MSKRKTIKKTKPINQIMPKIGIVIAAASLVIYILILALSLTFSQSTIPQKTFPGPGIDDDRSWIVQTKRRGAPLLVYETVVTNGGFWSGDQEFSKTRIFWANIGTYYLLSLLVSISLVWMLWPLVTGCFGHKLRSKAR